MYVNFCAVDKVLSIEHIAVRAQGVEGQSKLSTQEVLQVSRLQKQKSYFFLNLIFKYIIFPVTKYAK
jgi:Zn-dependent M16 (insulinase) family peptidase